MSRLLGALVAGLLLAAGPAAAEPKDKCAAKPEMLDLGAPLTRTKAAVLERKEIRIVAIGSSSTEGYGATSPFSSYPAELLRTLSKRLPGVDVYIANKGAGGEVVNQMIARIERDVYPEKPDMVIWQTGTNSAMRAHDIKDFRKGVKHGIELLKVIGADVVLMTPQYAPAVLSLPNEDDYIGAMEQIGREMNVGVFRRFQIMRYWLQDESLPFAHFINSDGLHLNDFGYRCIGRIFARSIDAAVKKQ